MAAAAAAISQDRDTARWQARALSLGRERHLDGAARHTGHNEKGGRIYRVPSCSDGSVHVVIHYPAIDKYTCSCVAGSWGRACSHVGAALYAERAWAAAERENEPSQEWRW